ncbi:MAG: CopG family transcriptional regulator [Cyanobium sp. ELA712]
MNSSEFDRRFEDGESVIDALDLSAARRPRLDQRRVNVDFPLWMVEQLDLEASRLGVTRQSIIKVLLAERLERRRDPAGIAVAESSSS